MILLGQNYQSFSDNLQKIDGLTQVFDQLNNALRKESFIIILNFLAVDA